MLSRVPILLTVLACNPPATVERPDQDAPPQPVDTATDTTDTPPDTTPPEDTDDPNETEKIDGTGNPDEGEDGEWLFDGSVVHDVIITIDSGAWNALTLAPREYAEVTFQISDQPEMAIGMRLKGNTTFRTIDDKPAIVLDFNRVVEDQKLDGLPSVYLHNLTYDPSMMHEHHAYMFFREVGVPASRTSYANVTINGQNYGLYLFVEKQNRVYRKRWWTDPDGSMFESGSFNWPCDFDEDCSCFEIDELAEGGEAELMDLCDAATQPGDAWLEAVKEKLDWERFMNAVTAEMVISHYDNYGWNTNNYRIYHDPTDDVWGFTPWSTDLSFGWYPWSSNPHCGEFAGSPRDYNGGYLVQRCWSSTECTAELMAAVQRQVKVLESMNMATTIEQTYEMITPYIQADSRRWYNDYWVEKEADCMIEWVAERPDALAN